MRFREESEAEAKSLPYHGRSNLANVLYVRMKKVLGWPRLLQLWKSAGEKHRHGHSRQGGCTMLRRCQFLYPRVYIIGRKELWLAGVLPFLQLERWSATNH